MKLALIFVSVLAATTASPMTDEAQQAHNTGPYASVRKVSNDLAPAERKFGRGDSQTAVMCAARCAQQFKADVDRQLPGYDQNSASMGKEIDVEKLNKLCPVHDTAFTCLNACPSSQVKTMLAKAFDLTQFVCHDSVIREKGQCINDATRSSQGTCSSQCGNYERKFQQYQTNKPTDMDGLQDMLKQTCLLTGCNISCPKAAVTRNCGQQAQNDLNTLGKKAIGFLKTTIDTMGLGSIYPAAECDRVGA